MDQTVFIDIASLRKTVLLQSVAISGVPCPASISLSRKRMDAASLLLSTTIEEEEEGEEEEPSQEGNLTAASSEPSQTTTSTLPSEESRDTPYLGSNIACNKKRCASVHQGERRKPQSAFRAIATFATATSKMIRWLFSANQQRLRCFTANGQVREEPSAVEATSLGAVPNPRRTDTQDGWKPAGQQQPTMTKHSSCPAQVGLGKAPMELRRHKHPSRNVHPHSHAHCHSHAHSTPHLVKLIDGDDVGLALHALQLAAQIHDHVFASSPGPAACGDPERRQAVLQAARPLYDEAKAAARAIRHSALRSLVKEAVRRYVDPCRGAPEDVLRIILEMLTGCGGTPSVAAGSGGGGGGGGGGGAQPPYNDVGKGSGSGSSRCGHSCHSSRDALNGDRQGSARSASGSQPRMVGGSERANSWSSGGSTQSGVARRGSSGLSGFASTGSSLNGGPGPSSNVCVPAGNSRAPSWS